MSNKPSILVVDDEASVLFTYRMILEQQGYEATAVQTCKQAVHEVHARNFDLLLCDLSLEEKRTGFEVFDAARERTPEIPCVLLTGYASKEAVDRADREGVAVLFKPIDIEEFLSTIAALLKDHHHGKAHGE
jgi:DNA-binding NtrC family response regulator